MRIDRETAKKKIMSTNGKFFSVQFEKKDKSIRDMTCRLGVKKFLKGGKSTTAHIPNLITVCEIGKSQYRCVNIDTLKTLKVDGQVFTVLPEKGDE